MILLLFQALAYVNYTKCQVEVEEKHHFQKVLGISWCPLRPNSHTKLYFLMKGSPVSVQKVICEFISKLVEIRLLMYLSIYVSLKFCGTLDVGERVDMWFGWYGLDYKIFAFLVHFKGLQRH